MSDPRYISAVPERSLIHVDGASRRRSDAAPSIDAIYERSRAQVVLNDPQNVSNQSHRSSRQMQNGVSRRMSEHHEGRRQSVNYEGRRTSENYEGQRPSVNYEGRRTSEYYEGRRPSLTHPNQVHPAGESYRGGGGHESRRHYERNGEFYPPHRRVRSGTTQSSNGDGYYDEDEDERYVVPALPMPVAVTCCVLNFILPGFGSMFAGFCVLCCGRTEGMTCREKCSSCCTVFGIGVLQLLLVACFLIGWIWSCIWGITFIGMSVSSYDDEYEYDDYPENPPRRRHVPTGNTPLPTPEVVTDQPFPGVRYEDMGARARERERRQRTRSRRTISRISLTPSNFIYPMRAPSSIHYSSPPPPYKETATPPPPYWRNTPQNANRGAGRMEESSGSRETNNNRLNVRQQQPSDTIYEEQVRR